MATMLGATDIPDWVHAEAALPGPPGLSPPDLPDGLPGPPLPEHYARALSMSPIAHVHKIRGKVRGPRGHPPPSGRAREQAPLTRGAWRGGGGAHAGRCCSWWGRRTGACRRTSPSSSTTP